MNNDDIIEEMEKRMRNIMRGALDMPFEEELYDIERRELRPLAQITETDEEVIVTVDLPCVLKESIDLKCTADTLTIKAKMSECVRLVHHGRREAEFENYRKSIRLPSTVDPDKAQASFKNGLLQVRLPRKSYGSEVRIE
jgi:HSP20 family protein